MRRAQQGLEELRKHVDTIIVVPNQNLFKIANEQTTFEEFLLIYLTMFFYRVFKVLLI